MITLHHLILKLPHLWGKILNFWPVNLAAKSIYVIIKCTAARYFDVVQYCTVLWPWALLQGLHCVFSYLSYKNECNKG